MFTFPVGLFSAEEEIPGLIYSSTGVIAFNGTSDSYIIETSGFASSAVANTCTFLIKLTTTETTSRDQDFLNSNDVPEQPRFTVYVGGPFTFYYSVGSGLWFAQSVGLAVAANTEYSLMVRVTGLNTGNFYVNGVSYGTGTTGGGASSAVNFEKQYILGKLQNVSANYFKGSISYLKIFNRAISDGEATALGFL